jgi:hypothetical protein
VVIASPNAGEEEKRTNGLPNVHPFYPISLYAGHISTKEATMRNRGFAFPLLTRCVAAIAAARPSAAVANIAAHPPFSLSSTFNFQLLTFNSPFSRRALRSHPPFPAVSRPRGRHRYGGGNGKYSFPAIFLFPSSYQSCFHSALSTAFPFRLFPFSLFSNF